MPRKKPRWPLVLGAISLVLGVFLMACYMGNILLKAADEPAGLLIISIVEIPFGLILPVGGCLLIQRKPAGRKLLSAWSWINSISGGFFTYMLFLLWAGAPKSEAKVMGFMLLPILLITAYAIFLRIWLTRKFIMRDLKEYC